MNHSTKKLVGLGLLTAIIVILEVLTVLTRFGVFKITLALIPIVIGAALYGWKAGAWLGLVFSLMVLFTDAGAFLAISIPGTAITVLAKGTLAGLVAGLIYQKFQEKNRHLAVALAAIITPVVNTGIFLVGCRLFFFDTLAQWAETYGFSSPVAYMFAGLVGLNFFIEIAVNVVLIPVILRLINIGRRTA